MCGRLFLSRSIYEKTNQWWVCRVFNKNKSVSRSYSNLECWRIPESNPQSTGGAPKPSILTIISWNRFAQTSLMSQKRFHQSSQTESPVTPNHQWTIIARLSLHSSALRRPPHTRDCRSNTAHRCTPPHDRETAMATAAGVFARSLNRLGGGPATSAAGVGVVDGMDGIDSGAPKPSRLLLLGAPWSPWKILYWTRPPWWAGPCYWPTAIEFPKRLPVCRRELPTELCRWERSVLLILTVVILISSSS